MSFLYNNNVATSVTSQGRALTSSATMMFEAFLGNNVKYYSLDEVFQFIEHVVNEAPNRKFNDYEWLDNVYDVTADDLFARLVLNIDYLKWVPDDKELDMIYHACHNLNQFDINRVYYKNHLYAFLDNSKISKLVTDMIEELNRPFMTVGDVPANIENNLILLTELLEEYVYYGYMYMDRIDRTQHMIRNIVMVSDTDSTIISLDAWYRYFAEKLKGKKIKIMSDWKINSDTSPITWASDPITFATKTYDYDFYTDEKIEKWVYEDKDKINGYDNIRFSLISIIGYVLDHLINKYMIKFCENVNSITDTRDSSNCRILMKNEFEFRRLLMTQVKKNYASLIEIQEGNIIPEDKQLDVKGIECMTKSSKALSTRNALKKILEEDILKAPVIDQLKFLKDITMLEKSIYASIRSGSKEFYKPATIKSMSAYDDPMRIQGIKASIAWNNIRDRDLAAINLSERNAIDIAKVNINPATAEKIKEKYPEIYQNIMNTLDMNEFKKVSDKTGKVLDNNITAIAIPIDVQVPEWLMEFIDYDTLVNDNIGQFPYVSIGITPGNSNSNTSYTNIIQF